MASVGKARVLGSSAKIYINKSDLTTCQVGEVDKFSAKGNSELKKSRPLGAKLYASQIDPQGWDLSFEGGKVDWKLAALLQAQDRQVYQDGRSPYFTVTQTIKFSDGTLEQFNYYDVTIHSPNVDIGGSGDEVSEKFEGFAAYREAESGTTFDTDVTAQSAVIAGLLATMTGQKPGDGPLSSYDARIG